MKNTKKFPLFCVVSHDRYLSITYHMNVQNKIVHFTLNFGAGIPTLTLLTFCWSRVQNFQSNIEEYCWKAYLLTWQWDKSCPLFLWERECHQSVVDMLSMITTKLEMGPPVTLLFCYRYSFMIKTINLWFVRIGKASLKKSQILFHNLSKFNFNSRHTFRLLIYFL